MIIDLTLEEIIDLAIHSGIEIPKENIPSDDLDQVICITKCHPKGLKDDEGNIEHYKLVMYFEDCPEEGVIPLGKPIQKAQEKTG